MEILTCLVSISPGLPVTYFLSLFLEKIDWIEAGDEVKYYRLVWDNQSVPIIPINSKNVKNAMIKKNIFCGKIWWWIIIIFNFKSILLLTSFFIIQLLREDMHYRILISFFKNYLTYQAYFWKIYEEYIYSIFFNLK